ncbi:MAG: single-stranded DNA-binding protein [Candidatus Yanofskybacteria bacterium]|nr:single-stranded DNA-binding protein [Candidatus Yanofskybacteria bacterium]
MNLNKIFLIGRLTQDPETRSTQTGQNVTTLRMATNRVWNDKSGQKQEAVEYHTVVAWARLGDIAAQYLKKGGLVLIEGRVQTRSWLDKENNKRYTTEIVAESLQLGPRSAGTSYESREPMAPRSSMNDVRRPASVVRDAEIPIIGEDEPLSAGVEESEMKIDKDDLPF